MWLIHEFGTHCEFACLPKLAKFNNLFMTQVLVHHWGGGKMAWVAILYPPPPTLGISSFLPHSP